MGIYLDRLLYNDLTSRRHWNDGSFFQGFSIPNKVNSSDEWIIVPEVAWKNGSEWVC